MTKKIVKFISLVLIFCMLISTVVFAEESEEISNMSYEEWLVEQDGVDNSSDVVQSDLEPVKIISQEHEQGSSVPQVYNKKKSGNRLLNSILAEKGKYETNEKINLDLTAENIIVSIESDEEIVNDVNSMSDKDLIRTAPTAGLVPVIVNEDSLADGQITTDTIIAFLYNDTDTDGDTIVNRYVDGNAVNYILGEIDGGFVVQITEPGSYQLYYQVEDSAGEFSRVLGYSIDVIQAPVIEKYQVFEGSFASADDSITYHFSIDFSEMSSAAICLVRKGYTGTKIEVFDENGNQVFSKGTGSRKAKNWGYIDKPSPDAAVCNYTVVAKPASYDNRASDYRIIVGDKNDTELMMSGIENTVLLEQYYEAKVNLENSAYVPNAGEYWFKYKRESTSVITILSDVSDIRFKLFDVNNTINPVFDSATVSETHKTSFTGNSGWICAEKARLTTVVGREYYLVIYSTNPTANLSLRTGSMATAVGNPVILGASQGIAGQSVTLSNSGYSPTITCNVNANDLPNTAQVREVTLSVSPSLSNVERWRMRAPGSSSWVSNPSSFWFSIDMNYKIDSTDNAWLKGIWSAEFLASSSGKGKTITPSFNFFYNYEYGD